MQKSISEYKSRLEETRKKITLKDRALQESTIYAENLQTEIDEVQIALEI